LEQAERFGDIRIRWIGDDSALSGTQIQIDDYEG
jgi:hypothetical protein